MVESGAMGDLTGWTKVAYIAACLVVPAAWGAFAAWLFTRGDKNKDAERPPHVDYMI